MLKRIKCLVCRALVKLGLKKPCKVLCLPNCAKCPAEKKAAKKPAKAKK